MLNFTISTFIFGDKIRDNVKKQLRNINKLIRIKKCVMQRRITKSSRKIIIKSRDGQMELSTRDRISVNTIL